MIRRSQAPEQQRRKPISPELAALSDRLEATERRQRQLQNTIAGLSREVGVSVGCPCGHCEESYTLIKDGCMYCPRCGHRQSL